MDAFLKSAIAASTVPGGSSLAGFLLRFRSYSVLSATNHQSSSQRSLQRPTPNRCLTLPWSKQMSKLYNASNITPSHIAPPASNIAPNDILTTIYGMVLGSQMTFYAMAFAKERRFLDIVRLIKPRCSVHNIKSK